MSSMCCAGTPAIAGHTLDRFAEFAREVEERGFHGLWMTDSFGRGRPTLDPIVLMSVAAAVTKRIEIGTCVLQVPVRHPVELAHRIESLHALTRRPADARPRLRLDQGRFRPGRRGLRRALQDADDLARHHARSLEGRAADGRTADPVAGHRGRAAS